MFERITIRDVATSGKNSISITFTVPQGWVYSEEEGWLAFHPKGFKAQGFALLMVDARTHQGPERLLASLQGLRRYIAQTLPGLQPQNTQDEADDDPFAPYDVAYFSGRIPNLGGRLSMIAMAIGVEDINFALFGFSRDELFDDLRPMFHKMIMSFQPLVQARHA
jgi:hypothetical protein